MINNETGRGIMKHYFTLLILLAAVSLNATEHPIAEWDFSGGNIIPTLGTGALIGIVLARVFPVEGYEQLFAMSFALSFFGFVTFNPLLSLSLVFSFGFSPALFIVLLPTAILPFLGFNRIGGVSSLSRSLASKDIGHRSYAASRFLLFPYSSSIAILRLASRAPLIEGGKGVD